MKYLVAVFAHFFFADDEFPFAAYIKAQTGLGWSQIMWSEDHSKDLFECLSLAGFYTPDEGTELPTMKVTSNFIIFELIHLTSSVMAGEPSQPNGSINHLQNGIGGLHPNHRSLKGIEYPETRNKHRLEEEADYYKLIADPLANIATRQPYTKWDREYPNRSVTTFLTEWDVEWIHPDEKGFVLDLPDTPYNISISHRVF